MLDTRLISITLVVSILANSVAAAPPAGRQTPHPRPIPKHLEQRPNVPDFKELRVKPERFKPSDDTKGVLSDEYIQNVLRPKNPSADFEALREPKLRDEPLGRPLGRAVVASEFLLPGRKEKLRSALDSEVITAELRRGAIASGQDPLAPGFKELIEAQREAMESLLLPVMEQLTFGEMSALSLQTSSPDPASPIGQKIMSGVTNANKNPSVKIDFLGGKLTFDKSFRAGPVEVKLGTVNIFYIAIVLAGLYLCGGCLGSLTPQDFFPFLPQYIP